MINSIKHKQSSHCETGVVSNFLTSKGLAISEPMVFGLASALAFGYLPFVKISGMPLISYRMPPKSIINNVAKKLGLQIERKTFGKADQGMAALDEAVANGELVGLQTSVYWLPYFPEDMRFHFNAHNLMVYGKNEQGDYLISDPVFEDVVTCPADDLKRARFAKGALAPKGLMYTFGDIPSEVDLTPHIYSGIKKTARTINGIPVPGVYLFGTKGIDKLASVIRKLDKKPKKYRRLYLGHIVRMQEEIGTGGAGFRFMFASFLKEAADITNNPKFSDVSDYVTSIGDKWREFAMHAVFYCKDRKDTSLDQIANLLEECSAMEKALKGRLLELV